MCGRFSLEVQAKLSEMGIMMFTASNIEVELCKSDSELRRKAQKWLRIASPGTSVYVRTNRYRAVVLFFHGTQPHGYGGAYGAVQYIPAELFVVDSDSEMPISQVGP